MVLPQHSVVWWHGNEWGKDHFGLLCEGSEWHKGWLCLFPRPCSRDIQCMEVMAVPWSLSHGVDPQCTFTLNITIEPGWSGWLKLPLIQVQKISLYSRSLYFYFTLLISPIQDFRWRQCFPNRTSRHSHGNRPCGPSHKMPFKVPMHQPLLIVEDS